MWKFWEWEGWLVTGGRQNLKQVPHNFIKVFYVDDVTLSSYIMTSKRKVNIASETIRNYRVSSSSNLLCQIYILAGERPGISVIIWYFLFARLFMSMFFYIKICVWRRHRKIFRLIKPAQSFMRLCWPHCIHLIKKLTNCW